METLCGSEFRTLLREHLSKKTKANPGYSLRSFARQLGVPASTLSMMMSGRCPITTKFIEKVGAKLKLQEDKIQCLQLNLLSEKLIKNNQMSSLEFIDHERFAVISDWYHYAILNLIRTKGFRPQTKWIAGRLGISIGDVQTAIERLQKVGLLDIKDGKWVDLSSKKTTHANNAKFSEAAKLHQKQVFDLALRAIDEVAFKDRNHTGVTIAMKREDIEAAKDFIFNFRKQFMDKFDQAESADDVYHLSMGLFPMSRIVK